MDKLAKKIAQCKTVKIEGVKYEFRRVTPEDFLGKEGIPISKWQSEAEFIASKERSSGVTWEETKKLYKRIFSRAIISIDKSENDIDKFIEILLGNYFVSNQLYSEIVSHCMGFKKKTTLLRFLAKQPA